MGKGIDREWPTPSPVEAAYLAGLFDGEGCVTMARHLHRGGRSGPLTYRMFVELVNTDESVVVLFHQYFGGHIYRREPKKVTHRVIWRWQATSYAARRAMEVLLPYLRIKRARAEIMIEYAKTARGWGGKALSQEVWDYRAVLVEKAKELNSLTRRAH